MTARDLLDLLRTRYDKSFCTSEIMVGRKNVSSEGRIDFLAIAPSWSSPDITGIETKVSRADFVSDNKWPAYLPYCNHFWFCTSAGIVKAGEIPEQAGWLEASANGKKLFVRKKAPRLPEIAPKMEAELFKSLILRHHFRSHVLPTLHREEQLAAWRVWIADKQEKLHLGKQVRHTTRKTFDAMEHELISMRNQVEGLEAFFVELEAKGITRDSLARNRSSNVRYLVERYLNTSFSTVEVEAALNSIHRVIQGALSSLQNVDHRLGSELREHLKKIADIKNSCMLPEEVPPPPAT